MHADKPCQAIFVTATDTGIGKTIVTAALAYHLREKGLNVGVMKPVETGVDHTDSLGPDGNLLRWAADSKDPDDLISPYRFTLPASPHQAARAENLQVDTETVINSFNNLKAGKDIVLVEGAGGLMVPLRGGYLMADLINEMDIPTLLVTQPYLGTINHTLLSTLAARTMGLPLCGMLINKMPANPGQIEKEAPHLLASLASTDLLAVFQEVVGPEEEMVASLASSISNLPTYPWLLNALGIRL